MFLFQFTKVLIVSCNFPVFFDLKQIIFLFVLIKLHRDCQTQWHNLKSQERSKTDRCSFFSDEL